MYKYSEDHKVDFLTFGEQYFGKRLCNDVKRLYVTLILIPLTASWLIIFDFPKINQYLAERMKVHSVALRMYFVEVNVSAHVVTLMIIPPLYLLFTKLRKPLRDLQWIGIGIFLLGKELFYLIHCIMIKLILVFILACMLELLYIIK